MGSRSELKRIPVVVDTDIGDDIDDALALAFVLGLDGLDLRAVTTTHGDVHTKSRLAAKLLAVAGRGEIPVATGRARPLRREPWLGLTDAQAAILRPEERFDGIAPRPAFEFTRDLLLSADEPLTLIGIGPLTNIARLITEAPEAAARIAELVVMGGLFARRGPEYNLCIDPEAAQLVFRSGIPVRVMPLEVGERCVMSAAQWESLQNNGSPLHGLLTDLTVRWQAKTENALPVLYDAAAIGSLVVPELFTFERAEVEVAIAEGHFQSQTVMRPCTAGACLVCTDVQVDAFLDLFGSILLGAVLEAPARERE